MFRISLIVLATLLAGGAILLGHQAPVRADMKRPLQILAGISFFFMLFFVAVRVIDDFFWWTIPAVAFILAIGRSIRRLDDIHRLIQREKPNRWLTNVIESTPITGALISEADMRETPDTIVWEDDVEPDFVAERRYLDNFFIADEADLGPHELDLEGLDQYVFTSRHAYLVHDHDPDKAPCDVLTVHPGMSLADLIEAAKQHECVEVPAA